ncbi:MAG: ABC transporter ATP-binding protein [Phycisphaerales bacterium]
MGERVGAPAVVADRVSKVFKLYERPSGRLVEWLTLNQIRRHEPYTVLREVSLEAARGECLGIIGRNGCGKSTLLRILSGSLTQTSGRVSVQGRVFALIELSTGFNPTLTGVQNIEFAAQMLGMDRSYIRSKRDEIIEFADLGRYIDRPLREYSSGMRARLSFSLFAFLEPDVLMIDEAFSVGDEAFQKKSYALLEQMITAEGRTVIFVSHAMHVMSRLCQRVAWLDTGLVRMLGTSEEVCDAYVEHVRRQAGRGAEVGPSGVPVMLGAFEAPTESLDAFEPVGQDPVLIAMWVTDEKDNPVPAAAARATFRLYAAFHFARPLGELAFVVRVYSADGWLVAHGDSSVRDGIHPHPAGGGVIVCRWQCKPIGLGPGRYRVSVEVRPIEGGGGPVLDVEEGGVLRVEGSAVVDSVYDAFLPPTFFEHPDDQ